MACAFAENVPIRGVLDGPGTRLTAEPTRTYPDTAEIATYLAREMIGRTYLERGAPVVVVARWLGRGPRNVLIRRADASLVVRPFRGLRLPR
jgi:hypothetical protein